MEGKIGKGPEQQHQQKLHKQHQQHTQYTTIHNKERLLRSLHQQLEIGSDGSHGSYKT